MMADVHVKGLSELQAFMDQLAPKLQNNIMRGALRAGLKVIQQAARENIHDVSGELAKGLAITTSIRNGVVKSILASKGIDGYVAMWVEFGTQPHLISVQESEKPINTRSGVHQGKAVSMTTINRRSLMIGNHFVGPTIRHPGARPKPFMRIALDSQAEAAVILVAEYVKNRLITKEGLDASGVVIEGDA